MNGRDELIKVTDLSAGYGGVGVLNGISFSLSRGEILSVIGANGSGKSTLLKTVSGELKSVSGKIFLDGRDLNEYSLPALSKKISLLLTDRVKPPLMTGRQVIETGRFPYTGRFGTLTDSDRSIADTIIKETGVTNLADREFMRLSDGERQRILFARALAQEPELLIMDEPFLYLDIRFKFEFLELIRSFAKEKGLSVIMSCHEADLAFDISDRIAALKYGRLFSYGDSAKVSSSEVLTELYDLTEAQYNRMFRRA